MKYIFQKNTEIPKKKDAMSGDLDFGASLTVRRLAQHALTVSSSSLSYRLVVHLRCPPPVVANSAVPSVTGTDFLISRGYA